MYKAQEEAINERLQTQLDEGRLFDLESVQLPFDTFHKRMEAVRASLSVSSAMLDSMLFDAGVNVRREAYESLFLGLFSLCRHTDWEMRDPDARLLEVLFCGWRLNSPEEVALVPTITRLLHSINSLGVAVSTKELQKIVRFLSNFVSKNPVRNAPLVRKQIGKMLNVSIAARNTYLTKMYAAFKEIDDDIFESFLKDQISVHDMGKARPFMVLLTNEADPVREDSYQVPRGKEVRLPKEAVEITQIMALERSRPKNTSDDIVMDMDYLLKNIKRLPAASKDAEARILSDINVQRESGAYTAEITQNSRDATKGMDGELVVDFYIEQDKKAGVSYFVEEAADNGTGALAEVALLIPKSTKASGGQVDLTGFFGTGKYTMFEGVDRVDIITKNENRAFMFSFEVTRDDSGKAVSVKLVRIRRINDKNLAQGVTVRRIKRMESTIPELDQMLSQRAWKTFAGLSQHDKFKIFIVDHEKNKKQLAVVQKDLAQLNLRMRRSGDKNEKDHGTLRIISTKDMPTQVVDKAGLRVCQIKDEYLKLIPEPLHQYIKEKGIVIQIPFPLIRNRSGFEHEGELLLLIQRYVAMAFYKAIAYLTLNSTRPQFVFEGFPTDWETNDVYWKSIDPQSDQTVLSLATKINMGQFEAVTSEELDIIIPAAQRLNQERRFVKLVLLLQVPAEGSDAPQSLLGRRLAIMERIAREEAERQRRMLEDAGYNTGRRIAPSEIPDFSFKILMA